MTSLKKPFYSALVFFGTLVVLTVGYAAYNLSTESANAPLTSTKWNAVINAVNNLDTRVSSLSSGGGAFWGNITGGLTYTGGNVGIGTTSPDNAKLHIASGHINLDNTYAIAWGGGTGRPGMVGDKTDGHLSLNTGGSERVRIDSTGNVGIGTTSPVARLDIHTTGDMVHLDHDGGSTSSNYITFNVGGTQIGSITNNGSWAGISFNTTSDKRLKENFMVATGSLRDLNKINVYKYNYKADPKKTQQMGFIAQELYAVYPQAVTVGGDNPETDPWLVDYSKIIPLLTNAVKEQQEQIASLQAEVQKLKNGQ